MVYAVGISGGVYIYSNLVTGARGGVGGKCRFVDHNDRLEEGFEETKRLCGGGVKMNIGGSEEARDMDGV